MNNTFERQIRKKNVICSRNGIFISEPCIISTKDAYFVHICLYEAKEAVLNTLLKISFYKAKWKKDVICSRYGIYISDTCTINTKDVQ